MQQNICGKERKMREFKALERFESLRNIKPSH
jgi:hypothetical protein